MFEDYLYDELFIMMYRDMLYGDIDKCENYEDV